MNEYDERGSGTLIVIAAALLVLSAGLAAVLWAGVSTARHRAAAAADLAALSAARAVQSGGDACETAGRIAGLHGAELAGCRVEGAEVQVVVGVRA
ncbi:MAG TPA: Rv3654c family TadE-like protein, partial [Kribbellaceae bacterium]